MTMESEDCQKKNKQNTEVFTWTRILITRESTENKVMT